MPTERGILRPPVFEEVRRDFERFANPRPYFQGPPDEELINYILRCEEFLWKDRQILPEMLSWVRWDRSQAEATRDGIPWQGMGVSYLASRLMLLVYKSRGFRRFTRKSEGPMRSQKMALRERILSAATLGCITVPDTSPQSLVEVGRAFLRAWVRLNLAGYGLQVMANASLHVFQHEAGLLPEDYPEESKQVFSNGLRVLQPAFGFPPGQIPAWMFRTGKSSPLPDEMRTLRSSAVDGVQSD